jgi:hypothetical protein
MECPKCGLISPENTLRCDCGYRFAGSGEPFAEKRSTDYRSGFRRVYAVAAGGWVLFFLILGIAGAGSRSFREEDALMLLAMAIGPPVLVYLLGFVAIPWIARGFKPKSPPTQH